MKTLTGNTLIWESPLRFWLRQLSGYVTAVADDLHLGQLTDVTTEKKHKWTGWG